MQQITTVGGHEIAFGYDDQGRLETTIRVLGNGITESLNYEYHDAITTEKRTEYYQSERDEEDRDDLPGSDQQLLKKVTLKRNDDAVSSVEYEYYLETEDAAKGRLGDLKSVKVSVYPDGETATLVEQTYYRYEYEAPSSSTSSQSSSSTTPQELNPEAKLLRIVVMDNSAIARAGIGLEGISGQSTDELINTHGATEIKTHLHADGASYQLRGLSAGSSATDLGLGGFTIDVDRFDNIGANAVRYEVTVTSDFGLPEERFELNAAREILAHKILADGKEWVTVNNYDEAGRLLDTTSPGGLTSYQKYFDNAAGTKAGLLQETGIKRGTDQDAVFEQYDYVDYGGVFRLSELTQLNGDNTSTTNFVYGGSKGSGSRTTILPAVSTAQHGTGQTDSVFETFDQHGRQTTLTDAVGLHTIDYNFATRRLTSTSGGLTTTTQFDWLGELEKITNSDGTHVDYQHDWSLTQSATTITTPLDITTISNDLTTGVVTTEITSGGVTISKLEERHDKAGRLIESEYLIVENADTPPKTTYEYNDEGLLFKTNQYYSSLGKITEEVGFDSVGRATNLIRNGNEYQIISYDNNYAGDGNITKVISSPGHGDSDRTTVYVYNWRNQLIATKQGADAGNATDVNRSVIVYGYDNLGRVITTSVYDGDTISPGYSLASNSVTGLDSSHLKLTSYADFDPRGQVYQTRSVDAVYGFEIVSGFWYDAQGRLVKEIAPGGLTTSTSYDSLGRVTDVNIKSGSNELLEQTHYDYDAGNRVIFEKTTQVNPTGANLVTAISSWYDYAGRVEYTVHHGVESANLGGRPANVPVRSSSVRRTDYQYSVDGLGVTVTDPAGVASYRGLDGLGRISQVREGTNQNVSLVSQNAAANSTASNNTTDKSTFYTYDGLGRLDVERNISIGFVGGDVTETRLIYDYVNDGTGSYTVSYNPTINTATNLTRTIVNNLLREQVEIKSNAGLDHTYVRDVVGRIISDVSERNTSQTVVADSGRSRKYTYGVFNNQTSISEFEFGQSTPRSVVTQTFTAFGQIKTSASQVDGVSAGTVVYHYENANGGVRATGVSYDDNDVVYQYTGLDATINRISSVKFNGTLLESYVYLGVATPQEIIKHLSNGSQVEEELTFDEFGQVNRQNWRNTNLHFEYAYNTSGNLTGINDVVPTGLGGVNFDQSFAFDALGHRTGASANGNEVESWLLDSSGLNRSVEDEGRLLGQQDGFRQTFQGMIDQNLSSGENSRQTLENFLEVSHYGLSGDILPNNAVSVQFDPWGNVISRKIWNARPTPPDDYDPEFNRSQEFDYDATGNLRKLVVGGALINSGTTWFIRDAMGHVLQENFSENGNNIDSVQRYVWSPVTGNMIFRQYVDTTNAGAGNRQDFVAVDVQGNTIGLFSAETGVLEARWYYLPSGEVNVVPNAGTEAQISVPFVQSNLKFNYFYQQGRFLGSENYPHGGVTILTGGQQFDALQNSIVSVNGQAFKDDVDGVAYSLISWWKEYGIPALKLGAIVGGSVAGSLATGGPWGGLFGASFVAGVIGTGERLDSGVSLSASIAGGLADGTGIGGAYTFATGDIAFTGRTESVGRLGQALGLLEAISIGIPLGRGIGLSSRSIGLAAGRTFSSPAFRLGAVGGVGLYASGIFTPGEAQGGLISTLNSVRKGLGTKSFGRVAPKSRGLTFVGENLGQPRNTAQRIAREFESGTTGAFSNVATRQRSVPALRFDNPKPNGVGFVKFDGVNRLDNGITELIDAKTRIVPFSTRQGPFISPRVRDGLVRKSLAIQQNSAFRAVLEFPTTTARQEAQKVLRQLGITNISTRIR